MNEEKLKECLDPLFQKLSENIVHALGQNNNILIKSNETIVKKLHSIEKETLTNQSSDRINSTLNKHDKDLDIIFDDRKKMDKRIRLLEEHIEYLMNEIKNIPPI